MTVSRAMESKLCILLLHFWLFIPRHDCVPYHSMVSQNNSRGVMKLDIDGTAARFEATTPSSIQGWNKKTLEEEESSQTENMALPNDEKISDVFPDLSPPGLGGSRSNGKEVKGASSQEAFPNVHGNNNFKKSSSPFDDGHFFNVSSDPKGNFSRNKLTARHSTKDKDELSDERFLEPLLGDLQFGEEKYYDHFRCPPCKCLKTLFNNNGLIRANCSFAGLSEIPLSLPHEVMFINISFNSMQTFNVCRLLLYPSLAVLDIGHSGMRKLHGKCENSDKKSNLKGIVLDDNLITEIKEDDFVFIPKLKVLRLSNNKLKTVTNTALRNLKELHLLDLSKNHLVNIEDAAFDSLGNLTVLYLNNNARLGYGKHFKPRTVQNLRKLSKLKIQGNSEGNEYYPNILLSKLVRLNIITIDGLGGAATLGTPSLRLTNLKKLNFGPNAICNFKYISRNFFQNVPNLISLGFNGCNFQGIDPDAFQSIPKLQAYSLDYIKSYDLDQAFDDLEGFQNSSSLKSISFVRLSHSHSTCRSLSSKNSRFLKNLKLEILDLRQNRLALIEFDFIKSIPTTLKVLNLSQNIFTMIGINIQQLSFLNNLIEIYLTNQIMDYEYKNLKESSNKHCESEVVRTAPIPRGGKRRSECQHLARDDDLDDDDKRRCTSASQNTNSGSFRGEQNIEVTPGGHEPYANDADNDTNYAENGEHLGRFRFPPQLRVLKASKYPFFAAVILFHNISTRNLREIDLSFNFLHNWGDGRLPAGVRNLNLDGNQGKTLTESFFRNSYFLRFLSLRQNNLGPVFAEDEDGTLFIGLHSLEYLDISANMIFTLPTQFFRGLLKLKSLKMNDNKLQVVDTRFLHMNSLRFIDFGGNSISLINQTARQDLDVIASEHTTVMNLKGNTLWCTCNGIDLLRWLASTKVFLVDFQYVECIHLKGNVAPIGDIQESVSNLTRQCASYPAIVIGGAIGLSGLILAFVVSAVIYRKRWFLLYSINNGLLVKLFGFRPVAKTATRFLFDAYVVYDEEDRDFVLGTFLKEMETKRGHRLCVEDRDFLPGTFIFNNTNSGVQNSAFTVFIVTDDFVQSRDFEYPLQMALLEEYHSQEKRTVCLLVVYGEISTKRMPKEMQMLMMNGRYLTYPPDNEEMTSEVHRGFWDRLSKSIGHTGSAEYTPLLP